MFKFIVPRRDCSAVLRLFADDAVWTRHSSHGRYVAVTVERQVASSDEVISVYRRAGRVKSVLPL